MYQYRHKVTGTVIHTGNPIFGGKWELVEVPAATKKVETDPVTEEKETKTKKTKKRA